MGALKPGQLTTDVDGDRSTRTRLDLTVEVRCSSAGQRKLVFLRAVRLAVLRADDRRAVRAGLVLQPAGDRARDAAPGRHPQARTGDTTARPGPTSSGCWRTASWSAWWMRALITGIGAAFGVPFPTRWPAIAVVLVLGAACFCALGVCGGLADPQCRGRAGGRAARLVPAACSFPASTLPIHSAVLNRVSGALPVRPFNQALMSPFAQHAGPGWKNLGVLLAWGAAGALVAVRRFRWDPRPE